MKDRKWLFIAAIALTVVLVFSTARIVQAQTTTSVRWEYHVAAVSQGRLTTDDLNAIGREGWELISMTSPAIDFRYHILVFKRRLP